MFKVFKSREYVLKLLNRFFHNLYHLSFFEIFNVVTCAYMTLYSIQFAQALCEGVCLLDSNLKIFKGPSKKITSDDRHLKMIR